jgi:hypothetical protein
MRKILELTEKQFVTGIAPSSQVQDKGLWHKAKGINFAGDILGENNTTGLIQAGPALTALTVSDIPIAWTTDVTGTGNEYMYVWGKSGYLYRIDLLTGTTITNLNTAAAVGAQGASANGIFLVNHSNGKKKLWYFRTDGIGYYGDINATPSFNTSVYTTNIVTTADHPVERLFDRWYFGNGRYLGSAVDDGAGGLTVEPMVLDFDADYKTKTISSDGTFLVVGITKTSTTDTLAHGDTKIIFWDQNSSSWDREWTIPDAAINSIRRVGSHLEAQTTRGLFVFTYNSPPTQALPYLPSAAIPDYQYPTHATADVVGEALLFGGTNCVSMFGRPSPAHPYAFMQPFSGMNANTTVTMVAASAKTGYVYIGAVDVTSGTVGKLFLSLWGDSTRITGVSAETIFIDLGRWYQIGRIVLGFDGQLSSGDNINIDVQPDGSTSASDWGTASYATHGAIRSKELFGSKEARKLKVIINLNGGAPRIRNLQVWGDPIEQPTHSRV